ncbi:MULTISPECIES: acyl-CoA thioesterase [unclassified Mycobacterium]|uniref:acyl-CoA thioesterase n=1 Tax=unclassified Mycobacterium TaxID=2642494 RepID=UPI0029C8585B|nr:MULTISPECIES: thioesterase family protein [unclassified Mycobacterium]
MSVNGSDRQGIVLAREQFRVVMGDTDAARVIYFGAPLGWAERLMTTWLADAGLPTSVTLDSGRGYPAVRAEVSYHSALRLDDRVFATLLTGAITNRSVTFHAQFATGFATAPAVEVWLTKVHVRFGADGSDAIPLDPSLLAAFDRGFVAPQTQ